MALELTTVQRVKDVLGAGGTTLGSDLDTFIDRLIKQYSVRFEQEMGRTAEAAEYTQTFDLEHGVHLVSLPAYPVSEIVSVKNDPNNVFDGDAIDPLLYYLDAPKGLLFLKFDTYCGPGTLQVVWVGGMSDDGATDPTASFIENYPDIAAAMDQQVAEAVRRKDRMGASNTSFEGGGNTYEGAFKLLPEVARTLALHRRMFS